MKLQIDRTQLSSALAVVGRVVPKRSPVPARLCVLLQTGDKVLVVSGGGNGDMSARVEIAAVDILEAGAALVDAERLTRLLASLDGTAIQVAADKRKLTFTTDSGSYSLLTFPVEDANAYGAPTDAERESASFRMDGPVLVESMNRVVLAAGRETSRHCFAGIYFKREGKKLELVATDGRRLAVLQLALAEASPTRRGVIVPATVVPVVAAAVDEGVEVRVTLGESSVEFDIEKGRVVVRSPLIEGAFVPYEDVVPKDQRRTARITKDPFTTGIRRAIPFTGENTRGVRFDFVEKEKAVTVGTSDAEVGDGRTLVKLEEFAGGDMSIAFNPQFVLDAVEGCGGDAVGCALDEGGKPAVFRSLDKTYLHCVMPVPR